MKAIIGVGDIVRSWWTLVDIATPCLPRSVSTRLDRVLNRRFHFFRTSSDVSDSPLRAGLFFFLFFLPVPVLFLPFSSWKHGWIRKAVGRGCMAPFRAWRKDMDLFLDLVNSTVF